MCFSGLMESADTFRAQAHLVIAGRPEKESQIVLLRFSSPFRSIKVQGGPVERIHSVGADDTGRNKLPLLVNVTFEVIRQYPLHHQQVRCIFDLEMKPHGFILRLGLN